MLDFTVWFCCCCYSVSKSRATLWDPMNHSVSGSTLFSISELLRFTLFESVMLDLTISSSFTPSSSCLQSLPASGSFPISRLFTLGGQSIGPSASVLPMNIQGWFHLGLTGLISLQVKGLSRVFSNTTVQKHQFFGVQPSLWSNSHLYMTTGKTIVLTDWTSVGKVMSLFFNTLSRFVITFLARSKHLLFHGFSHHLQSFWSPRK